LVGFPDGLRAPARRYEPVTALLYSLGGFALVCLLTALFVLIARFTARHVLDENDGSSL